jgi:PAS domain S-box-containing protein
MAENILNQDLIGIMEIDNQGNINSVNPKIQALFNCDICLGSPLKTIDESLSKRVISCMERGKNNQTFHIQRKEGGVEVQLSLIIEKDEIKGANCFVRSLESLESSAWMLPNMAVMNLQFKALMDHSYYGIYILDDQGSVIKVNDVAAELVGFKKEDIIGINIQKLVEMGIINKSLTPSILKTKKPLTLPIYVKKSNKYIMASGLPVLDKNGDVLFVVVIEHDMTIVKELRTQLEKANQVAETIKSELSDRNLLELKNSEIIADAPKMKQVLTVLLKLARMDASNLLITGESGTGKGFLSKFVHSNGIRKNKPFISINCAALPEMLLEAELFGYEKGAFTGASDSGKAGLFELANQGTIFLDEIGDLPFSVQAKLLKCLDDGEIRRLGGTEAIKINCIVLAATNHNLEELVEEKKFRHDLYFRLNIFPIEIPPLRERREDILKISTFYLNKYNTLFKQKKRFSEKCIEDLLTYNFPGNVRELKNIIKNAVVIKEKDVLVKIIPAGRSKLSLNKGSGEKRIKQEKTLGFNEEVLGFERKKLVLAMENFDSTRDLADYLGISQSTVVRKLKKHGLSFD